MAAEHVAVPGQQLWPLEHFVGRRERRESTRSVDRPTRAPRPCGHLAEPRNDVQVPVGSNRHRVAGQHSLRPHGLLGREQQRMVEDDLRLELRVARPRVGQHAADALAVAEHRVRNEQPEVAALTATEPEVPVLVRGQPLVVAADLVERPAPVERGAREQIPLRQLNEVVFGHRRELVLLAEVPLLAVRDRDVRPGVEHGHAVLDERRRDQIVGVEHEHILARRRRRSRCCGSPTGPGCAWRSEADADARRMRLASRSRLARCRRASRRRR